MQKLIATVAGVSYEADLDELSPEMIFGLARKGLQETISDGAAGKESDEDKAEGRAKRLAEIIAGTYAFGGGSKGVSPHDKAVREILRDNGYAGWKKLSEETLDKALENFTQLLADKQGVDWNESMPQELLAQIENADGFDAVVKKHEPKPKTPKVGIDISL